jgi:hypothetical protein
MTLRTMLGTISVVALVGCGSDGAMEAAGKGRVAIVMSTTGGALAASLSESSRSEGTCQPDKALQAASVTFSSILARTLDGKLIDVAIDLSKPVNLLELVNGKEATLPMGSLPPGTYDQIVVVMKTVELTLVSGMKVAITPPGGGWTAIVPVTQPFTVKEGSTTTIALNFRMDLSFACAVGDWDFHPRFECNHTHDDKDKD